MESNRPRRFKSRNQKKKIQMDWSHIKKRGWGNIKSGPTMEPSRKQEDLRIAGEDRSSRKRVETGKN